MPTEPGAADFAGPDLLLLPAWTLLPEGAAQGLAVLVRGGRFAAVGPVAEVVAANPDLVPLALPDRLLMPGMVDAHTHLTQSLGKALAFGEPSEIFRRIWVPLEASLDEARIGLSARLAALEALRGGFTTVVEAGTRAQGGLEAVAAAARDVGVRCVLGMIQNDGHDGADAAAIRAAGAAHLARFMGDALVHPSLAISIPEAASDGQLGMVYAMCAEAGVPFQTHVNEHLAAVERSLVARGRRPIGVLRAAGALGPRALLAHATLVTPEELALLRDTGAAVAYNPVASLWKGNAVAPALTMSTLGIPFGIGTDGTRGDGFRLLDAAEGVQRAAFGLATGDSSCGGGWLWLEHGTGAGAAAVGLGGVTGVIAAGLAADFLVVDLLVPELVPSWDLPWELVRLANRDQIEAVVVGGRLRLWRGWPTDWDARALLREVAAVAGPTVAAAPIQRVHPTSAEHRARRRG